jgi:integrase
MAQETKAQSMTIAELAEQIVRFYKEKGALDTQRDTIRRMFRLLEESGVKTTADINNDTYARFEAFLASKKPPLSPKNRRTLLQYLKATCNYAVKLHLLARKPAWPEIPDLRTPPKAEPSEVARAANRKGKARSVLLAAIHNAVLADYGERISHGTRNKLSWLIRVLEDELGVATRTDLEDSNLPHRFIAYLDGTEMGGRSRATRYAYFKTMYRRAKRLKLIGAIPSFPAYIDPREVPLGSRTAAPTERQVKDLIGYLKRVSGDWEGRRLFALTALVLYAAIKPGVALNLRLTEIDLAGGVIWVRYRHRGHQFSKIVEISKMLRPILAGWRRRAGPEWLFPSLDGTSVWSHRGAVRDLQAAARAAGLRGQRMTFDRLRRYYIEHIESRDRQRPVPTKWTSALKPSIVIRGDGRALVYGRDKGILTDPQRQVLGVLLAAGPRGLSKKGMTVNYGDKPGWRQVLIRMRKDRDWCRAIGFPGSGRAGKESGRYRISPL